MKPRTTIRGWREYYDDIGLRSEVANAYIEYIKPILRHKIPPILDLEHLSLLLGRKRDHLASLINATGSHYREFSIPKRNGGRRRISAPYPSLLECQQWIHEHILNQLHVHEAAHGFVRGRSIFTNARAHLDQDQLLKFDIKDFFPTIEISRVIGLFNSLGYNPNISVYLAKICTLDGKLPQGAATSPGLSNLICYRLDARLYGAASKAELRYSRYADDITISGSRIDRSTIKLVRRIISEEGLEVNESKVRLLRESERHIVTGLDVTGKKIRPTRSFRRELSQEIYYAATYGIISHTKKEKITNPRYVDSLAGKLSFWEQLEPENAQLLAAKKRLASIMEATAGVPRMD